MASYLDARVHGGKWLIRIEDLDQARCISGASEVIVDTLKEFGLESDEKILFQSQRKHLYDSALKKLLPYCYSCSCSRREIADSSTRIGADGASVYPGTCRTASTSEKLTKSIRLRVPNSKENDSNVINGSNVIFEDRWQGSLMQDLANEVGDFILKRADGFWAYQLAVVVDDAEQGITHVVRGADLLHSTARQIYLQKLLGYSTPVYLHIPVAQDRFGEKLSKHNGAFSIRYENRSKVLMQAAQFLGLSVGKSGSITDFWRRAEKEWDQLMQQKRQAGTRETGKYWQSKEPY